MAGPYKNEDDVKAELRFLTEQTRKLRQELRADLARAKPDITRALLHTRAWTRDTPITTPPAAPTADDSPKRRGRKKR
jgi:hypothetical protein